MMRPREREEERGRARAEADVAAKRKAPAHAGGKTKNRVLTRTALIAAVVSAIAAGLVSSLVTHVQDQEAARQAGSGQQALAAQSPPGPQAARTPAGPSPGRGALGSLGRSGRRRTPPPGCRARPGRPSTAAPVRLRQRSRAGATRGARELGPVPAAGIAAICALVAASGVMSRAGITMPAPGVSRGRA